MHRLRVPVEYLVAALLAVGLAGGFFALRQSQHHGSPAASPPAVKSGASAPAASPATAPARDPRAVQLLSELRRAYEHVPAVVVSGSLGASSVRFTEILDHGKGRAEAFIGGPSGRTTRLVAPEGEPTFAQAPGSSCWHVLPHSAPQTLTDIGQSFPDIPAKAAIQAPRPTHGGWLVEVSAGNNQALMNISANGSSVSSITVTSGARHAIEHIQTLQSAPKLPVPEPRC